MDRASLRNNRDAVHKSPMTLVLRTTVTTACITRALLPSTVVNCNQLVLCVLVMCQYRLCRYRYDIDLSHRNIGDIDVSSILLSLAKQDSVGNSAIFFTFRVYYCLLQVLPMCWSLLSTVSLRRVRLVFGWLTVSVTSYQIVNIRFVLVDV